VLGMLKGLCFEADMFSVITGALYVKKGLLFEADMFL
jgi:hypothetical protein